MTDGNNKRPKPVSVAGLPFSVALRLLREEDNETPDGVAAAIGVEAGTVRAWESEAFPPGHARYEQLCQLYPDLRLAQPPRNAVHKRRHRRTRPVEEGSKTGANSPDSPAPNSGSGPRLPFHEALRQARERNGQTRADLAGVLGLKPDTIKSWEYDHCTPGPRSYERLCQLYPALRRAAPPRGSAAHQHAYAPASRREPANRVGNDHAEAPSPAVEPSDERRHTCPAAVPDELQQPAHNDEACAPTPDEKRTSNAREVGRVLVASRKAAWRDEARELLRAALHSELTLADVVSFLE